MENFEHTIPQYNNPMTLQEKIAVIEKILTIGYSEEEVAKYFREMFGFDIDFHYFNQ